MPSFEYCHDYTVTFSHIDCRGLSRPSAVADFIQDAATVHASEAGLGRDELIAASGAVWVLSRLKYRLSCPLLPYQTLSLCTWHRGVKGALWYRDFSFFLDGKQVGEAYTAWAVVDLESRRLLRPATVICPELLVNHERPEGEVLNKLRPDLKAVPVGEHTVCYSDIDVNNHLNNVKAIDIVCDALQPQNRPGEFITELQVNYLMETPDGSRLNLSRGSACGQDYVFAEAEGHPRFEAAARFAPIEKE